MGILEASRAARMLSLDPATRFGAANMGMSHPIAREAYLLDAIRMTLLQAHFTRPKLEAHPVMPVFGKSLAKRKGKSWKDRVALLRKKGQHQTADEVERRMRGNA